MARGSGFWGLVVAVWTGFGIGPVAAQVVVSTYDTYEFKTGICVGLSCPGSFYTGDDGIRMIDTVNQIFIDDTSTLADHPNNDWRLIFNDPAIYGEAYFGVEDATAGTLPFKIEAGAPASALVLDASGFAGLGTASPLAQLHVMGGLDPALRLEQDGSQGETPYAWEMAGDDGGWWLRDVTAGSVPLQIAAGAPDAAWVVDTAGQIGLGTATPGAALHLRGDAGAAKARIEEVGGTTTARTMLELLNNGRPEIVMGNTATGGEWAFGVGTNFSLKQGAVGSKSSQKKKIFTLKANGDAKLLGELTTGGTTCGTGCDRVFDEDFALPTIRDHAKAMFALGHLPNVGPTPEGAPLNVSDKLGRVLNELEHAHIYIAELEAEVAKLRQGQAALAARLNELARD